MTIINRFNHIAVKAIEWMADHPAYPTALYGALILTLLMMHN